MKTITVGKIACKNLDFVFSFHTCISQKLCYIYKQSAHQTTALLSEIRLFFARAVCKLRLASYGRKYTSRCLSYTSFCAYLQTQLENQESYKDILPSEWLLCYQKYLFSWSELYAVYDRQVTAPNTYCSRFGYDI